MAEAERIVRRARALRIDTLDTAVAYGTSESVLGEIGVSGFRVVTKLPPLEGSVAKNAHADPAGFVERLVVGSLRRLNVERLEAVLFHRSSDARGSTGDALGRALADLQAADTIGAMGISVYSPTELENYPEDLHVGLIQAPVNALDTRLEDSGWTARLTERQIRIHSRSAFLQGLRLMAPNDRPAKFNRWAQVWRAWDQWRAKHGLTPLQAAAFCVLAAPGIERIVVGVDTEAQLRAIAQAVDEVSQRTDLQRPVFHGQDTDLLTPIRWNSL